MPDPDLVVRGVFLVDGRPEPATLLARDGRVLRLERGRADAPAGARVVDVGERLVLPGAIDPHVHFRDPGHPEKEDFASGTTAAAFGGVTTVLDMPNTNPPTVTRAALAEKKANASEKAVVDFGLYSGLAGPDSLDVIAEATCVKVYLGATTGPLLTRDYSLAGRAVVEAAKHGKTVAFHAEDQGCMESHAIPDVAEDDWAAHARSRPNACESNAVFRVTELPSPPGARKHIAHLSTEQGLAAIIGTDVTSEAAPHHLWFTEDDLAKRGAFFKMNPPLRSARDVTALWAGLRSGDIDCVASDHAPHTLAEKRAGVREAPSGVPGTETMVPLLVAKAAAGELDLAVVQRAACERAGEIFGLPKGKFEAGFDADFAVYDLARVENVRTERLHSKCGWTPFEGLPAVFPTDVWVRGEPVVTDGRLEGSRGRGRFLDGAFRPR